MSLTPPTTRVRTREHTRVYQNVRTRRRGWAGVVAAVIGVALVASGCGGSARPDAATVGNTHIERADFEAKLRTLIQNKQIASSFGVKRNSPVVPPRLSAVWLQNTIIQAVVDNEFHRRNLKIAATDRDRARANLTSAQAFGTDFKNFPATFRNKMVDRGARYLAVITAITGPTPTPAVEQAYFRSHKSQYLVQCPGNLGVSHILVATKAEADAISKQLAGGADFAKLASEKSVDTGSKPNGGSLGCYQAGQYVKPFEDAVKTAKPGVPTAPVKSQYGYHIIRLDDVREPQLPKFEEVKPQITQQLSQQKRARFQDELRGKAKIE